MSRVRAPSESPLLYFLNFKELIYFGLFCWHGSMVEQLTCNQQVVGSIPIASSILKKHIWLLGQAVKTPPFHGGNRGSIPLEVTIMVA